MAGIGSCFLKEPFQNLLKLLFPRRSILFLSSTKIQLRPSLVDCGWECMLLEGKTTGNQLVTNRNLTSIVRSGHSVTSDGRRRFVGRRTSSSEPEKSSDRESQRYQDREGRTGGFHFAAVLVDAYSTALLSYLELSCGTTG